MFVLSLLFTEYRFLHKHFLRSSSDISHIDKFSIDLHTLQPMSRFFLYHSYSKISKNMGTLGKFNTYRKTFGISVEIFVWLRHLSHMTKMAATPIYGKNPSKFSSPEPEDRFPRKLVCRIGDSCISQYTKMMTLG